MVRIREARKHMGISQAELASMLNVHQTAISQWESEKTYPDIMNLMRMADIFGVSVDYLLGRKDNDFCEIMGSDEIVSLYNSLPDKGKETAMNTIRALASYPEFCETNSVTKKEA